MFAKISRIPLAATRSLIKRDRGIPLGNIWRSWEKRTWNDNVDLTPGKLHSKGIHPLKLVLSHHYSVKCDDSCSPVAGSLFGFFD